MRSGVALGVVAALALPASAWGMSPPGPAAAVVLAGQTRAFLFPTWECQPGAPCAAYAPNPAFVPPAVVLVRRAFRVYFAEDVEVLSATVWRGRATPRPLNVARIGPSSFELRLPPRTRTGAGLNLTTTSADGQRLYGARISRHEDRCRDTSVGIARAAGCGAVPPGSGQGEIRGHSAPQPHRGASRAARAPVLRPAY